MFLHDTLLFKALVGDELEYRRLVAAASGAVLQLLPGYKGPVFRPSLEAPQTIIEAELLWNDKYIVVRTNPSQVCTTATICAASEEELNQAVLASIPHKYKDAVFDRVWLAPGVVQHRCTISCNYVALDTFEELRAFWLPMINALSGGTDRSFGVRTYSEAVKDFLFTDMTRVINIKTMLQCYSSVTIAEGDDTVVPYTSYEMRMEINMPEVHDLSKLMELGAAIKASSRQISASVVSAPCAIDASLLSAMQANALPTTTCTAPCPVVLPPQPPPPVCLPPPIPSWTCHPTSNSTPSTSTLPCPPPQPPPSYCQVGQVASLEQALQELNQINTTFQTLSRSMLPGGAPASVALPTYAQPTIAPRAVPAAPPPPPQQQPHNVLAHMYRQYAPTSVRSVAPAPYTHTIMTHVSQPIPSLPTQQGAGPAAPAPPASSASSLALPMSMATAPRDTTIEGSETQIDNLCRILENFITTIAPE